MKDPSLTAPILTESDFSAAGLSYAKNDKGQMLSLPWSVDYFILYYNKEIFQKAGVQVPKTLDEMNALAEKLTDTEGRHLRLRRARPEERQHDAVDQLSSSTTAANSSMPRATSSPRARGDRGDEILRALEQVLAAGVAGFNWMESLAAFAQGRAAM
jgi:multiple sugar transport system substrate-binding protein